MPLLSVWGLVSNTNATDHNRVYSFPPKKKKNKNLLLARGIKEDGWSKGIEKEENPFRVFGFIIFTLFYSLSRREYTRNQNSLLPLDLRVDAHILHKIEGGGGVRYIHADGRREKERELNFLATIWETISRHPKFFFFLFSYRRLQLKQTKRLCSFSRQGPLDVG